MLTETETGTVALLYSRVGRAGGGPAADGEVSIGLLGRAVAAHGGRVARTTPEELMAVFQSGASALACAAEAQREAGSRGAGLRIGVNVGEVVRQEGDYFGTAVVVTRRLCERAEPGQILISELVRDTVGSQGGPALRDAGSLSLEGLADPLRAYELGWAADRPDDRAGARADAERAEEIGAEPGIPLPRLLSATERDAFVGREAELDRLGQLTKRARSGRREVCFVAGDPGVGKTSLCRELAARAHAEGWLVLYGHPQQENVMPFQPFVEALRHWVANSSSEELQALAGDGIATELGRILPELRRRLAGLAEPAEVDPDTARFRMFEAIAGLTFAIARRQPLLLVLDDLHWADKPTLLLLRHLLDSGGQAPLAVVGTYRESELAGNEALAETLSELEHIEWISLGGLSLDATRDLVAEWAGVEPPREFVNTLRDDTAGNPFFVREVLRHLHESGTIRPHEGLPSELSLARAGIPEGIREVIGRRLSRLSDRACHVLSIASVLGREFPVALLERTCDVPRDELLQALEEAAAARLVTETPGGGRYAFSHSLIRETLYGDLSTTRRVRLHLRIGEALERLAAGELEAHVGELADHFLESAVAGDVRKAVDYANRAGERALDQLAYEEAARYYERGLAALELQGPPDAFERCDLLLALGEAHSRAGEAQRARRVFDEAASLARELGAPSRLAAAAIGSARRYVAEPGVIDQPLIDLLEEALDVSTDDGVARVRLLGHLCVALYYSDERERIDGLSREALTTARELGDPEALAYAQAARRRALWRPEHLEERLAAARDLVRLGEEVGNFELALQGHGWLVVDLLEGGDMAGVEAEIDEFRRAAEQLGQPLYAWTLRVWDAMRAQMRGEFDLAERLSQEAVAAGQRAESLTAPHYFAVQIVALRRDQGRIGELEGAAREFVQRYPAIPAWRSALAAIHAELGREDEARAEFERIAAHDFADVPRDANWLTAVTLAAEVCATLGDSRRAEVLYDLLLPYADALIVVAFAAVCHGSAARLLGLLAGTMGRMADAVGHFEEALKRNQAIGHEPMLARTQAQYADVLIRHGDPSQRPRAVELAGAAAALAGRLGMPAIAQTALSLKREAEAPAAR